MAREFDPNSAAASDAGVFGLPYDEQESALVYLPVPWEATTSYGGGTSEAPQAILDASKQVDLFDGDVEKPYEPGLYMLPESGEIRRWNLVAKALAQKIIEVGGNIGDHPDLNAALEEVNNLGSRVNDYVGNQTRRLMSADKLVGVVGGDHSVPFGALQAVGEKYKSFGILHFDAHSDTRNAYEGFAWSHASIMHNVLEKIPQVTKITQVGIRDYCEEEWSYIQSQGKRMSVYFDRELSRRKYQGTSWAKTCEEIVATLPHDVWVSFDIDGLDPRFCPHTGTPVPGGMDFNEANYLLGTLVRSGHKIIGFDLNEVSPGADDEWDANVGARLLYKLSAWALASQDKCKLR